LGNANFYYARLRDVAAKPDAYRTVLEEVLKPSQTVSSEANFREFLEEAFNPH
jgi:hypothetical protein